MDCKLERQEDGSFVYTKKVVTLQEEVWSEEQFNDNYLKLKNKISEILDKIEPLQEELDNAQELEVMFLNNLPKEQPTEENPESEDETEPEYAQ